MKHQALRREIISSCIGMNARGINQGTSGNISVRVKEGFLALLMQGPAADEAITAGRAAAGRRTSRP